MNRKKTAADFFFHAGMFFAVFMFFDLTRKHSHFNSVMLPEDVLGAILGGLGIAGVREMKRGGHRRAIHFLDRCFVYLSGASLILFGVFLLVKVMGINFASEIVQFEFVFLYLLLPLWAILLLTPLPLALYLNQKQNKTNSQPTIADAS